MKCFPRSLPLLLLLCSASAALAIPSKHPGKHFDKAAQAALATMKARATALNIQGVAVVAFAPADSAAATVDHWTSRMEVVGHLSDHTNGEKGNNLLAIAYAKASEMANTLKNSGTAGTPPMTGEFGWQGGLIEHIPSGYLIVAFSGGKSEDDLATSQAGLATLKSRL